MKSLRYSALLSCGRVWRLLVGANNAHAVGVAAGTTINNTAAVDLHRRHGDSTTATSNTVSVTVAEILDVDRDGADVRRPVAPGTTGRCCVFRVDQHRQRSRDVPPGPRQRDRRRQLRSGRRFAVYLPGNGQLHGPGAGVFEGTDVPYVAGSEPVLSADECRYVFVVNDIPAVRGRQQPRPIDPHGRSAHRQRRPGHGVRRPGRGRNGCGRRHHGRRRRRAGRIPRAGRHGHRGEDADGARPVRRYASDSAAPRSPTRSPSTPSGSGTATATMFTDNIPAGTTYVPGSLTPQRHAALGHGVDADAGVYETAPAARVRVIARRSSPRRTERRRSVRRNDQLTTLGNAFREGDTHDQGDSQISRGRRTHRLQRGLAGFRARRDRAASCSSRRRRSPRKSSTPKA